MDDEYLFLNPCLKPDDTIFNNDNINAKNVKSVPFFGSSHASTHGYSSDEECSKSEGGVVAQLKSRERMSDAFNATMNPDDFMFSEMQECSFSQDLTYEQELPSGTFSPARYFDLFGEVESDDLQFVGCSNSSSINQFSHKELKRKECKKADETKNKSLLNGVLNHRALCPSLPRMKQVGTVTSCGTILRQSASMPNTRIAVSRMKVHKNVSPDSGAQSCSDSSNSGMDIGRPSRGTYSPLEDHRYYARVKRSESPPPLKKRNFSINSGMHSKSCSSEHDKMVSVRPKMSILETFLRATCPLDPNKGSDAALATEGMLNLCIREPKAPKKKQLACNNGSNNLLKKLLTGEIDDDEEPKEPEESSARVSYDSSQNDYLADSLLIDGFGLDAGLSIDEKGIFSMPDCTSNWQEDFLQMGSLVELEESVKLQDHQDALCMQHYSSSFL